MPISDENAGEEAKELFCGLHATRGMHHIESELRGAKHPEPEARLPAEMGGLIRMSHRGFANGITDMIVEGL